MFAGLCQQNLGGSILIAIILRKKKGIDCMSLTEARDVGAAVQLIIKEVRLLSD